MQKKTINARNCLKITNSLLCIGLFFDILIVYNIKWMCIALKYGVWNAAVPEGGAVNALVSGGYAPLVAMILAARGIETKEQADHYLGNNCPLPDPFLLTDMDIAAGRVGVAMSRGETIAVYGDYDVDGITATCLLSDFLRRHGAHCIHYIPGRIEEGYGLNPTAIHSLKKQGVSLIITVDCGITAIEEAALCKELGIDLVITDHHECKDILPDAVAVVDPHRPDGGYPHKDLSGVGVAFKLAAALCGSQEEILADYADMVCLGTVADVMPMRGENRVFVSQGLNALHRSSRPGLAALMKECDCAPDSVSASSIGFMLAPRINAAGRMEKIDLATELFLTKDPERATYLARALCELNRQRQTVEAEIYQQAVAMLPTDRIPDAIVLAGETWHQGVVGIVASRIAEEYNCPTFLICMDEDHGKASSRSYGGFNLFSSLSQLSDLLESYGGHELAAGFTIHRDNIDAFRTRISQMARDYYADTDCRTTLDVDCCVSPELLSLSSFESLSALEPCGTGCPKPVLMMERLTVERLTMVSSGRHLRLRLRQGRHTVNAIYFSCGTESGSVVVGDLVDIVFAPHINEYRNERSVQLNILDIRPSCSALCTVETKLYRALCSGNITPGQAAELLPDRTTLGMVWRYLAAAPAPLQETPMCLCRKIVRWSGLPLNLGQLMTCLDIFADVKLLTIKQHRKYITVHLNTPNGKADLNTSRTMQRLLQAKES